GAPCARWYPGGCSALGVKLGRSVTEMAWAVGGGGFRTPKPSRSCTGASTLASATDALALLVSAAVDSPVPPSRPSVLMRRSISTNSPESGRLDQSELAVTWNSTSWLSPSALAVTRGVPSASLAHTF